MKYNDKIQKYYGDTNYVGSFDEEDLSIGSSLVGAPACGDVMKLQIKIIQAEKVIDSKKTFTFIIEDARIKVFGCGSAKASSSLAVEMLIGKDIESAKKITNQDIKDALGLPDLKIHCSVLAEEAIREAIEDFERKNNLIPDKDKQNIKTKEVNIEDCSENQTACTIQNLKDKNNFSFNLKISQEAEDYLNKFLSKQKETYIGLRIDLESSNCGLSYKIKGIKDPSGIKDDIIFKTKEINFFIEKKIAGIINNTEMEFKKDGLKSGIFFKNPNEVGKCGCGINFKLQDTKTDESSCNN